MFCYNGTQYLKTLRTKQGMLVQFIHSSTLEEGRETSDL